MCTPGLSLGTGWDLDDLPKANFQVRGEPIGCLWCQRAELQAVCKGLDDALGKKTHADCLASRPQALWALGHREGYTVHCKGLPITGLRYVFVGMRCLSEQLPQCRIPNGALSR